MKLLYKISEQLLRHGEKIFFIDNLLARCLHLPVKHPVLTTTADSEDLAGILTLSSPKLTLLNSHAAVAFNKSIRLH